MDSLSNVLAALSHPSRRAILDRLSRGPACVTEIAEPFDMSLNPVSKHLKVLEAASIIRREVLMRSLSALSERHWLKRRPDHVVQIDAVPFLWIYRIDSTGST